MTPITSTLQVRRWMPGKPDAHGNVSDTWSAPIGWPVYGFGPDSMGASSTESPAVGWNRITTDVVVYAPTAPHAKDKVIIDGADWCVDGDPSHWDNGPWGYRPGWSVRLRRVDG